MIVNIQVLANQPKAGNPLTIAYTLQRELMRSLEKDFFGVFNTHQRGLDVFYDVETAQEIKLSSWYFKEKPKNKIGLLGITTNHEKHFELIRTFLKKYPAHLLVIFTAENTGDLLAGKPVITKKDIVSPSALLTLLRLLKKHKSDFDHIDRKRKQSIFEYLSLTDDRKIIKALL